MVDLLGDVWTDVHEVAGALVGCLVAQCFFHDLLLVNLHSAVVIILPPAFLDPVVDVRVVVPILRQAVVDQDCVQLIRSFFVFDVG